MIRPKSFSLFAQAADRRASLAYLLGAVIPLSVLGIVMDRHVLAPFQPAKGEILNLGGPATLALFVSIAMLSLACFLVLRRV